MALVGNISGSGGTYSTVGITGSVIFAYTDTPSAFPTLPAVGGDVVFFVSGSTTGKNGAVRNVAVFGGDTVISGSLTIGSGSVKLTSNDIQFSDSGTRIERNGNNIKFFDASNTGGVTLSTLVAGGGGGGGGGTNFFFDTAGAGKIHTTASSVAFRAGQTSVDEAADMGAAVVFYVSGSAAGDATALFGGRVVTSGSIVTKTGTGALSVSLGIDGTVSGSGTFSVGGDLLVQGSIKAADGATAMTLSTSTGNVIFGGNIVADAEEAKEIFVNVGANNVTVGGASSTVVIGNTLQVNGNIAADANEAKTIFSEVTSNTISIGGAGSTVAADTLTVGGGFGSTGVTISSTGGISADGNLIVNGDLTVRGTTTTLDTTNLLVEDPIIYFGSGSTISNQPGGIALASGSSVTHQALVWGRVANDTWGAGRLDVQNGTVTDFASLTNYLPVRASKLELGSSVDGAGAVRSFASSSLGTDLILSGTSAVTIGSTIINFQRADSNFATLNGNSAGNSTLFAAGTGRSLTVGTVGQTFNLSGSIVAANFSSSTQFQKDGTPVVSLTSPTVTTPFLVAAVTNSTFTAGTSGGGSDKLVLSGTLIESNTSNGFKLLQNGTTIASISSPSAGELSIIAESASTTANIFTANATTVNFAAGGSIARTVNLATGGAAQAVTVGSTNTTSALTLQAGTAAMTHTAGGAYDVNAAGAVTIDSSGGAIGIGTDAVAQAINVGTGEAARTITIGNGTGATSVVLNAGTGNIDIGANAVARTTNIATGAAAQTVNIATGAAAQTVTIGSTNTTSALTLQAGSGNITSHAHVLPSSNNTLDLGSPTARWRNMYTGDLHLKNERGNWTIIEEREYLSITNNITGKRYKFVLQEIE